MQYLKFNACRSYWGALFLIMNSLALRGANESYTVIEGERKIVPASRLLKLVVG